MTLSVELLSETPVSTAVCIDGNIYVNVWTSAPTLQQLHDVIDGERRMPRGYRSIDIIERVDKLAFDKGVKELFQNYAKEVSTPPLPTTVGILDRLKLLTGRESLAHGQPGRSPPLEQA